MAKTDWKSKTIAILDERYPKQHQYYTQRNFFNRVILYVDVDNQHGVIQSFSSYKELYDKLTKHDIVEYIKQKQLEWDKEHDIYSSSI